MPERIPDTPENILKTVLAGPTKKDWKYLNTPSGVCHEFTNR